MKASSVLLFCLVLLLVGCGSTAPDRQKKTGIHYWTFVDESASVAQKQKVLWLGETKRLAGRLHYGDAIEVYPIHARTADAAPLFRDQVPLFEENGLRTDQETAKRERARVRREAKQALDEAINPKDKTPVKATDILGAFDRFRPDPSRRNTILIFSDGLESADPKLNLERTCLARTNPPDLIVDLARRRHWHSQSLAGASVFFVLPAVNSNDVKTCNDSGQLRRFYAQLIEAMGGNLADFNTNWNEQ